MKTAASAAQMLIRLTGLVLIVLGILFWTGHARNLVSIHMLLGLILVVSLWILAVLALVARVGAGFAVFAILWGAIVLILGMTQTTLMPGSAHWVIRLLHLLVGLAAMGLGERLGERIRAERPATV